MRALVGPFLPHFSMIFDVQSPATRQTSETYGHAGFSNFRS